MALRRRTCTHVGGLRCTCIVRYCMIADESSAGVTSTDGTEQKIIVDSSCKALSPPGHVTAGVRATHSGVSRHRTTMRAHQARPNALPAVVGLGWECLGQSVLCAHSCCMSVAPSVLTRLYIIPWQRCCGVHWPNVIVVNTACTDALTPPQSVE